MVVADIPPKFGVLLSRSWTSKLKGSLQMDMSYAMIHVQDGSRRLYSEKRTPYVAVKINLKFIIYMLLILIWGLLFSLMILSHMI